MKKTLLLAGCIALLLLVSCSKDSSAPSSLKSTSWKYSASTSTYQVLKFTSASAGTYYVTTSGSTKSYSFSYTYSSPNVTVKVSNGNTLDGDFTSTTTLEVISGNSPTSALKFTKQ
jgi:hypothetical protein